MKLYHGSYGRVRKPNLSRCRANTDFGKGFYTTTNYEQAVKWAKIIQERQGVDKSFVSVYEIDDDILEKDYKIKTFNKPTKEWLDFVSYNRDGLIAPNCDIVKGPVADDKVYVVLPLYKRNAITAEAAISQLKPEKLFDQLSFHSINGLKELRFIKSIEIK